MVASLFRKLVNDHWLALLVGWVLLAVALKLIAPRWEDVALDGDLDYLPASASSVQANQLLRDAFPDERTKSQAVLIFAREDQKLSVEDRQYALDLALEIEEPGFFSGVQGESNGDAETEVDSSDEPEVASPSKNERLGKEDKAPLDPPLVDVWHDKTEIVSRMLKADDGKAELVIARVTNGLMAFDNIRIRDRLQQLLDETIEDRPEGLQVGLTGSTIIGGDMRSSVLGSLEATHKTTILLVLACLLVIYRAPLLVLIPLATIGVSMSVAYDVVALLADNFGPGDFSWSNMKVFTTTKIFVVVILFGAGTDYCLFLIARYKEELRSGTEAKIAPGQALNKVGDALAGSAFTTILGLATMVFAEYGKFSGSGPVIAVCLSVALLACITFAPALLRAVGPRVFFPVKPHVIDDPEESTGTPFWQWISHTVQRFPATILLASAAISAPLIYMGTTVGVTHDLLGELPPSSTSVQGAELIKQHFGEGWVSPITVVAKLPAGDLNQSRGKYDVAYLHQALHNLPEVTDVRSLYLPTGGNPKKARLFNWGNLSQRASAGSPLTIETFVSEADKYKGLVTQLSVVLDSDPFAKSAREQLPAIEKALADFAAKSKIEEVDNPWYGGEFYLAGTTPGMRDLESVTDSDRTRIQVCTVTAVFLVLVLLLRRPGACVYLIVTVLLSYWATIGLTEIFFQTLYGDSFHGLDWKVPIFLFVILIAVGQDYNIYLATRVFEEQAKYGLREGLHRAVVQTGGIITSCGVIMAGTFISMATGSLRAMVELGFALALGVLLDTFFVRTIVVPCYFALVAKYFGNEEKRDESQEPNKPSVAAAL